MVADDSPAPTNCDPGISEKVADWLTLTLADHINTAVLKRDCLSINSLSFVVENSISGVRSVVSVCCFDVGSLA